MNRIVITDSAMPVLLGQGLLATAEGFTHADRQLPFHVLIYVLEGAIHVTEAGIDYTVRPGELLFLRSGLRHYGKRPIPRGTRWYYVHFELPEAAENGRQMLLPKYISGLGGSNPEEELAAFVEACRQREETGRWYLNQQLFVLLSHIGHYAAREATTPDLTERITRYLAEHADRPFSAKALEKTFFLSYKHMAAVFKKATGQTMLAYHQRLRMEEGARLLRETLLPIGEISDRLGFADQLYFSRCFHSHTGLSPSRYRKEIREY